MGSNSQAAVQKLLRSRHVHRARMPRALPPPCWGLGELSGRLVELSAGEASASLTVATSLVLEAQRAGEPSAWIVHREDGTFFPPDLADAGVDLAALIVIQTPPHRDHAMLSTADRLLRCGGFGLLVLDLGQRAEGTLSLPAQTRLAGLAKLHDAVLLCLTCRPDPETSGSLGSLVSLHATTRRFEIDAPERGAQSVAAVGARDMPGATFCCEVRVVKDKRRGPGWIHCQEGYHGPPGLR